MTTKKILLTGSTDGIGKLTALKLAQKDCNLLLHGRNKLKLKATIQSIKEQTKNPNIEGYVADFSDFKSVKKMILTIKSKHTFIDTIINNAGVYNTRNRLNSDGIDQRFAVNYLSPYLVVEGLLSLLTQKDHSLLLNLSSAAQSTVDLNLFTKNQKISEGEAYAQSKLALTMWSYFLSQYYTNLNVLAVNPGSLLNTKMVKEAFGQYWSPVDKGADVLVRFALETPPIPAGEFYFDNDTGQFNLAHDDAYNLDKIEALLKATSNFFNSLS